MGWVEFETIWFKCPDFADVFEWCETLSRLQAARVIIRCDEVGDVYLELSLRVIGAPLDRCFLNRSVHSLDLTIRPGMVHLGEPLVDIVFPADAAEDVLESEPIPLAIGELDIILCENCMDFVGHRRDEIAQKLGGHHLASAFMQFDICELGCAVDSHEEAGFAFAGAHFSNVDMEIPDWVTLERLLGLVAFDVWQAADPMPLQASV